MNAGRRRNGRNAAGKTRLYYCHTTASATPRRKNFRPAAAADYGGKINRAARPALPDSGIFSWFTPAAPAWVLLEFAEAFPNDAPTVPPITAPIAASTVAMDDFLLHAAAWLFIAPFVATLIAVTVDIWAPVLLAAVELFCDACALCYNIYTSVKDWYERRSAAKN
ncbi:MAG: hypothetical protein LBS70_08460 [Candidatus Accumulibacter sp.]|jgi:hypothetical protein|nr:hypothetical protein [Accumulibacter sp.]